MAKKILKNRTQFTNAIKNDLYINLQNLSEESGVPISKLLDQAVELLIKDKIGREQAEENNQIHMEFDIDSWIYTNLIMRTKLEKKDISELLKEIILDYIEKHPKF